MNIHRSMRANVCVVTNVLKCVRLRSHEHSKERTVKTTLLIMVAGIGSHFGTEIKQLEPVDDAGHSIMATLGLGPING